MGGGRLRITATSAAAPRSPTQPPVHTRTAALFRVIHNSVIPAQAGTQAISCAGTQLRIQTVHPHCRPLSGDSQFRHSCAGRNPGDLLHRYAARHPDGPPHRRPFSGDSQFRHSCAGRNPGDLLRQHAARHPDGPPTPPLSFGVPTIPSFLRRQESRRSLAPVHSSTSRRPAHTAALFRAIHTSVIPAQAGIQALSYVGTQLDIQTARPHRFCAAFERSR